MEKYILKLFQQKQKKTNIVKTLDSTMIMGPSNMHIGWLKYSANPFWAVVHDNSLHTLHSKESSKRDVQM